MSRSVTFNGITQYRPGGLSKIDANALAQIGLNPNGIVGLIGEAEGGEPGVVVQIDDPALAVPSFTSGPLADAIRIAFDPSGDTRVPAGAFRVLAIKANQSTQSALTLYGIVPPVAGGRPYDTVGGAPPTTVVTLATAGLTVDAHIGNYLRIGTEECYIEDNDATTVTVTAPGFSTPVLGTAVYFLAPQYTYTSRDYGTACNRIKQELESGAAQGVAWTTDLDGTNQTSEDVCGRSYLDLEYIGQSTQIAVDSGTTDGAGDINTIADSTKTWGVNALLGYFLHVNTGGGVLAVNNLRKISANAANTIDVSVNFSGVPGVSTVYSVRRGAVHTGTLVSATAGTVTLEATTNVAVNEFANLVLAITGGTGSGQRRVIASNTAGVSSVLTLVKTWTTTPDATSTYAVRYVTAATATISGSAGASTSFATSVAKDGAAAAGDLSITFTPGQTIQDLVNIINQNASYMAYIPNGVNGLALVNDFDYDNGAVAVELRPDRSCYTASPFPVFSYTPTAGVGDTLTMANGIVTVDDAAGAFTDAMVGRFLKISGAAAGGNNGFFPILGRASTTKIFILNAVGVTVTEEFVWSVEAPVSQKWPNHFRKDLSILLADLNDKNQWATVARAAGASLGAGTGLPEFTGSGLGSKSIVGDYFQYMTGGTRGSSTNTNWQACFDALLLERCVHVVPLISYDLSADGFSSTATVASVAAQLAAHVTACRGVEKNECGGYMGVDMNLANYIAQANALNDIDVQLTAQKFTFLNAAGTLTEMPEWSSAVAAAGMRAGMPEVGEPLTHKFIKTTGVSQDSGWNPLSRTDANKLIQNGCLFAEYKKGKGTRWVRDLTTWIKDDNLAFAEGSTRDVCRYVSYGLRTFLEDRFTGVKAKPANAAGIKLEASAYLELCRGENIIVDSTDANGNVILAYHNMRVNISGDVARVRVEVFPAVGINFQLTEIFLQLPTQSA